LSKNRIIPDKIWTLNYKNVTLRLKYRPILTKKTSISNQNLDEKFQNCTFPLKYLPTPAKKSTNTVQNLDDKLKNITLSHQKSANFSQKIEIFQTKFVPQTEVLIFSSKKICQFLSKNRMIPDKIWILNYKNVNLRLKYRPILTKKTSITNQNLDEKFQNCTFLLKYLPTPAKKSNNTRQNLDVIL